MFPIGEGKKTKHSVKISRSSAMMKMLLCLLVSISTISTISTVSAASACSNNQIDCSGRGQCLNNSIVNLSSCLCDDEYIRWPIGNVFDCNYKQDRATVPFALHFVFGLPTGCGAFMLGENNWGISQVVIFWGGIVILCVVSCCLMATEGNTQPGRTTENCVQCSVYCAALLWGLAVFAMWISVLVLIGTGKFTDENGAPIVPLQ